MFSKRAIFWPKRYIPSFYFCAEDLIVGLAEIEAVLAAPHHNNIIVITIIIV